MHEAYVELNGVRTRVITYGRWIEELDSTGNNNEIAVVVPGNPGVVSFYSAFSKKLHDELGISVWIVGHAGHNLPEETIYKFPRLKDNPHLYNLKGQCEHKVDFFRKYVPQNTTVHLIGHSIGSYMALDILEDPAVKNKVQSCFLLHPTIEYMRETRLGFQLNYIVRPMVNFIIFLAWIFTVLPNFISGFLLSMYMILTGIPRHLHYDSIKHLVRPVLLRRIFFLGFDEMDNVRERNNENIKKNVKKLKFIYGSGDRWTNPKYWEKLKKDIPDVDYEVTDINHTFVFTKSEEMACKVAGFIRQRK